jgi:hypothetical protein
VLGRIEAGGERTRKLHQRTIDKRPSAPSSFSDESLIRQHGDALAMHAQRLREVVLDDMASWTAVLVGEHRDPGLVDRIARSGGRRPMRAIA